jgi:hypothetical protein
LLLVLFAAAIGGQKLDDDAFHAGSERGQEVAGKAACGGFDAARGLLRVRFADGDDTWGVA